MWQLEAGDGALLLLASDEALLLLAFLRRVLAKVEMSQLFLPLAVAVLVAVRVAETVVRCGWFY